MADEDIDYTIIPNDDYVASTYIAPKVILNVANAVERIIVGRDVEARNSILAFVSGDREEQIEYAEGFIGIGAFLTVMIVIWLLTLLLLKCQGRERMGCATGYAFHDTESDNRSVGDEGEGRGENASVGAAVDSDDSVAKDDQPRKKKKKKKNEPMDTENQPESFIYDSTNAGETDLHLELDHIVQSATHESEKKRNKGEPWSLHSLPRAVQIGDESVHSDDDQSTKKAWGKTCLCSPEPKHVNRRKFQTRAVFALFAIISLMCCLLLITNMYRPLESAALTTGEVVQDAAGIVDDLNEVLDIVDEATAATVAMIQTTELDFDLLCPELAGEDFEGLFGFDAESLIETVSTEFQTNLPTISDLLRTAQGTGDSVTSILLDADAAISTANQYLWIVPLIICITLLIIFSQLALMLAVIYREEKFKSIKVTIPQVENCYGWTILPLQIIVVLVSWLLVIAFCFGAVITTDTCVPSFSNVETGVNNGRGTPDDVVLAVIDQYMVQPVTEAFVVDLAKERVATYITGCGGRPGGRSLQETDPLAELIVLQGLLQDSIKEVETNLSFVYDVLGLEFLQDKCGSGNQVGSFFRNLTVLNSKLSNLNKAIKLGYDALSCPRVNTLYVKTFHGALCTDFATANANGLILFLMLSVSGMIMITLRASWRSAE